jgi:hypothetical protein
LFPDEHLYLTNGIIGQNNQLLSEFEPKFGLVSLRRDKASQHQVVDEMKNPRISSPALRLRPYFSAFDIICRGPLGFIDFDNFVSMAIVS